jgi:hypothetical protein
MKQTNVLFTLDKSFASCYNNKHQSFCIAVKTAKFFRIKQKEQYLCTDMDGLNSRTRYIYKFKFIIQHTKGVVCPVEFKGSMSIVGVIPK